MGVFRKSNKMNQSAENTEQQNVVDKAVAEGGAYEILNKRLQEQANQLQTFTQQLNDRRIKEFGNKNMEAIGRIRVRTENNCIPRDIVRVGDCLLLGYNVFIGLKKETTISDVFSIYRLIEKENDFDVASVSIEESQFLTDPRFVSDFNELYTYYKNTKLIQLVVREDKLLASFQIGENITDVRVFRWALPSDGKTQHAKYIDNRGERDIALPSPYDFEWQATTREMLIDTARRVYINLLNILFIEHRKGSLFIKVEDNTENGELVHTEILEDENQSLGDIRLEFAELGSLILLKLLPYREQKWRYLVFNKLTKKIERIDALGLACIQLPEDHGIIFPGGYYLQNGDFKTFDIPMENMLFERVIRSPNGEDVLYTFYEHENGASILLNYDVIARELQAPIFGHGYARYEDGRMIIFKENSEATRIHPMQIWQTPYYSDEFADKMPAPEGFLGKVGNIDLVRGISDFYELCREISSPSVSIARYTALCQKIKRLFDAYHWLNDAEVTPLPTLLQDISSTAELVLDEYEKVESIQKKAIQSLTEAQNKQKNLLSTLMPENWTQIQEFIEALNSLTALRGFLLTIREYRYMDVAAIDKLEEELLSSHEKIASATAAFLSSEKALEPFQADLEKLNKEAQEAQTVSALMVSIESMHTMANSLDTLTGLMSTLKIEDTTQHTQIIESISNVYSLLNQSKSRAEQRKKSLVSNEAVAQFGAQFQLFSQSITSSLSLATTPEKCDEQLSRLLIQLEELESQFGEHEEFISDILGKREEVLENFGAHKQSLLDERQRKAQNIQDAALRILETIPRRIERLTLPEEINAFFASDPLVLKLRELAERLRDLQDSMRADDVDARLKTTRDQAIRALRDKTDLFEEGGNVIKLGPRHRFSVNTQELDLTLLPKDEQLCVHLTGTDYFEPLKNEEFTNLRDYWQTAYESETPELYRAEYLVIQIIIAAKNNQEGLSLDLLKQQLSHFDLLSKTVRDFATPRYKEGYVKGIHDHDATLILSQLLPISENAGLLRYAPTARAIACLYWQTVDSDKANTLLWVERAKSSYSIQKIFNRSEGLIQLQEEMATNITNWLQTFQLPHCEDDIIEAATYLVNILAAERLDIIFSKYGKQLYDTLTRRLQEEHILDNFTQSLEKLDTRIDAKWYQLDNALKGLCQFDSNLTDFTEYIPEAITLFILKNNFPIRFTETDLRFNVENMMGSHPRIKDQCLSLSVDGLFKRARYHLNVFLPNFQRYQSLRQEVIHKEKNDIRLSEFKPRPLTSFVRNKLINDVYLTVIGDNLAKQMGTVGESKRTDLMGLLLLISPPGYGKTTLMEYVAARLGLIFMKINGPSLGHRVHSLDPSQAPDATSRQELEKLNLALEMGNNVMLYVDDIQHTSPEFLQKFISLCDGTRRIEGVWRGQTKTYDMRGRRFCVVMAGNPYTESGEVFKIPDMLANRADIYNLGETLGGMQDAFELSYIENALTSNAILAPLATRSMEDLYLFVAKAQGKEISNNEFGYDYSSAEINEIISTLKHLIFIRDIVSKVNAQYIISAAQNDEYRTEPAFKLQGSYRNMNKMAEKISAVMNENELKQLIDDHYQGESQLLTMSAEENLLKLAEIRGILTEEQALRWSQIKQDFQRKKSLGGSDDTGTRIVAQLHDLSRIFSDFSEHMENKPEPQPAQIPWEDILGALNNLKPESAPWTEVFRSLEKLTPNTIPWEEIFGHLQKLAEPKPLPTIPTPHVEVNLTNQPQEGLAEIFNSLAESLEKGIFPMIRLMDRKLDVDLKTQKNIVSLSNGIRELANQLGKPEIVKLMEDTRNIEEYYGKDDKE